MTGTKPYFWLVNIHTGEVDSDWHKTQEAAVAHANIRNCGGQRQWSVRSGDVTEHCAALDAYILKETHAEPGKLAALSMGERDGDTLVLENQWARVTIQRYQDDESRRPVPNFHVSGCVAQTFDTLADAITYAMEQLALYQLGRAD